MDRHTQWTVGLLFLGCVVVLWVLSSFLVNDLLTTYPKPFFITYLNTTTFMFYLIPYWLRHRQGVPLIPHDEDKLTWQETSKLSAQFCILWYFSNFTTNASLRYTSVSSQTILSSTLSIFTLLFGYWALVEHITSTKLVALVLSLIGVVLVNGHVSNLILTRELLGNSLLLLGAIGYGIYAILLKLKIPNHDKIDFPLFFGLVGFYNLIGLWVPLIFLHLTGVETWELPQSSKLWYFLLINALSTFISDYLWLQLMILTTPLTTTVGLSLTIPLLMLGDYLFNDTKITILYLLGAILVSISFIIINKDEEQDTYIVN